MKRRNLTIIVNYSGVDQQLKIGPFSDREQCSIVISGLVQNPGIMPVVKSIEIIDNPPQGEKEEQ